MKTRIIAVVGGKKSGKTTAVEALTRELTKRSYKVAAVKHISEEDFSFDTEGKDTWRFAQAGAKTIIAVSPNEVVTIEKRGAESVSLREILRRCKEYDVILLEGFKKSVARNQRIYKIVTVKSAQETREAMSSFKPILLFAGPFSTENLNLKVPYLDVTKDFRKLADVVESVLDKKR
jgi:molybdopterin-guanine dinucleotide biosynthesis protein MobB